jgi:UDP-glucuronate 4-epimerase
MLENVIGKPVIREQHPLQMGDVPLTWADISKSARMLGYRPRTSLEQGLTNFVRWYRDTNGIPVEVSKAA